MLYIIFTYVTDECATWNIPLLAHLYLRLTVQCDDGQTLRVFHKLENRNFKGPCDDFSEAELINESNIEELSIFLTTDNPLIISPNPSTEKISISYLVAQNKYIDIAIYNLSGQKNKQLVNTNQKQGTYLETVDITDFLPGQYLVNYRIGKSTYSLPFVKL